MGLPRAISDAHRRGQRLPLRALFRAERKHPLRQILRRAGHARLPRLRPSARLRREMDLRKLQGGHDHHRLRGRLRPGIHDDAQAHAQHLHPARKPAARPDGHAGICPGKLADPIPDALPREEGGGCIHAANAADRAGLLPRLDHRRLLRRHHSGCQGFSERLRPDRGRRSGQADAGAALLRRRQSDRRAARGDVGARDARVRDAGA